MSLVFDGKETDRLLAAADEHLIDVVEESQPTESLEILGAVQQSSTDDADNGARGMVPPEGSGGEMREGEGQCQGPSPVDSSNDVVVFHQIELLTTGLRE